MPRAEDWPAGYGRRVLAEIDSTNAEAARIADTVRKPEWILALRQTAGRGRRGRPWADPAGNFAATLVLPVADTPGQAALRSFVASLALFDAFVAVTRRPEAFSLKWPNDVLLNGGKVAGILLERPGAGPLAIGVGVNLAQAPQVDEVEPGALRPVSLLSETGVAVSPEEFLTVLAAAFAVHEATFATQGFAPIRAAWLARAARLGTAITARTGKTETSGKFIDVDDTGNLILQTETARVAIPAAEIYF